MVPTGVNLIPCRTTIRLFSPLRVACIGAITIVLATWPNKRGPSSTAGRFAYGSKQTATRRNKYQRHDFSFTFTNAVQGKSATQIGFESGICCFGLKDFFFAGLDSNWKSSGRLPPPAPHAASMALYLSSACRLPGCPSTKSRPFTLNRKSPRLCNRGLAMCLVYGKPLENPPESFVIGNRNGNISVSLNRTGFQTAHPQNVGGAIHNFFVVVIYNRVKQSGRHDSNMRPLGPKPSALPG